jgi:hypothetical protein
MKAILRWSVDNTRHMCKGSLAQTGLTPSSPGSLSSTPPPLPRIWLGAASAGRAGMSWTGWSTGRWWTVWEIAESWTRVWGALWLGMEQQSFCGIVHPATSQRSSRPGFRERPTIKLMDWSGSRPDLNHIKNIWPWVNMHLRSSKAKSLQEMQQEVTELWVWSWTTASTWGICVVHAKEV